MSLEWLVVIIFGWPAVLLSLGLTVVALVYRRSGLLLAAALVAVPFGLYLSANPIFRVIGPALVLAFLLASLALRRQHAVVAMLLTVPFFAAAAWLLAQVLGQTS